LFGEQIDQLPLYVNNGLFTKLIIYKRIMPYSFFLVKLFFKIYFLTLHKICAGFIKPLLITLYKYHKKISNNFNNFVDFNSRRGIIIAEIGNRKEKKMKLEGKKTQDGKVWLILGWIKSTPIALQSVGEPVKLNRPYRKNWQGIDRCMWLRNLKYVVDNCVVNGNMTFYYQTLRKAVQHKNYIKSIKYLESEKK
jgi:hypothetical protein